MSMFLLLLKRLVIIAVTLIILLLIAGRVKRRLLRFLSMILGVDQYFANHKILFSITTVYGVQFTHVKNIIVFTTIFMNFYQVQ